MRMIVMKQLKKWIIVLAIFFMSFSGAFATIFADDGKAKTQNDEYLTKIKKRGYLIVGMSADYAPLEFHATVKGQDTIVGADVQVAQKIANDMGVKLQIKELGFDALIGAMNTGKVDMVISGMSETPEREKQVLFSEPYMYEEQAMVIRKADEKKYKGIMDFNGKTIGAQKQTMQETVAKQQLPGAKVRSLEKATDIVGQVINKKIDGAVLAGIIADSYAYQDKSLKVIYPKFVTEKSPTAVAMPLKAQSLKTQVNKSINTIKKQGLFKKYLTSSYKIQSQNSSFWAKYGNFFITGTLWTLAFAAIAVFFGSIIGTFMALMKISKNWILKIIANVYIEFIRGTPLLVQAFMIFFGTQIIGLNLSPFMAGAVAMAINSGAYVAEIIRSGINSVPLGQKEAAASLGFSYSQSMRFVIMPQALKSIWPALGNEFVTVIKESSVLSVIGATELMFQASIVQGASFKPFLPVFIAAMIYFVLTFGISRILALIETHSFKH